MVYIYVLKLKSNKYYVGKTDNPNFRLNDHFDANGSEWTRKYKPITIHELRPDCDSKDETIITQEYMEKYGIDNVRGGPWCRINIDDQKLFIQNMINSESDNCYKCGKPGHFANKCTIKKKPEKKKHEKKKACSRCGRSSHTEENCYAKTDIHGDYIIDSEEEEEYSSSEDEDFNACFRCGRIGHYANTCYARKDINGRRI